MADSKKTLRVKLIYGKASTLPIQRANLHGLGLKKVGQVRELEDTPAIRGMLTQVHHLVEILK